MRGVFVASAALFDVNCCAAEAERISSAHDNDFRQPCLHGHDLDASEGSMTKVTGTGAARGTRLDRQNRRLGLRSSDVGDSNRPSSMGVQGEQSGCAETLHMCTGRMIHDLQPDDKSEQGDRLPLPAADRFPSGWRSQYVKMMEMTWNSNPHARPSMVTSLHARSPPHVSASGRHEQGLRGAD